MDTPGNARRWRIQIHAGVEPPGALNYFIAEVVDAFTQGKAFAAWQWGRRRDDVPDALKGKVMVVPPPGFKDASGKLNRNYIIAPALGDQPPSTTMHTCRWRSTSCAGGICGNLGQLPEARRPALRQGNADQPGFDDIYPWNRTYKYMLQRSTDFWHDPRYAEMLATQQEGWNGYMTGEYKDRRMC